MPKKSAPPAEEKPASDAAGENGVGEDGAQPGDDLADLTAHMNRVTDESLESRRRMVS